MRVTKRFHVEELELNMTPMIDIVFLLIIFFLVVSEIASFDHIKDLELPMASAAILEDELPGRLVISIDTNDRIFVGGQQRTVADIGRLLQAQKDVRGEGAGRTNQPVLIQADEHAKWSTVQKVIEKANDLKFWRLSFSARMKKKVD